MRFFQTIIRLSLIIGLGILPGACASGTKGWSSVKGKSVSKLRLAAAKEQCRYQRSRKRAIELLGADGNKSRNERRAGQLLENMESCMRKHGLHHGAGSAAIGLMKIEPVLSSTRP